MQSNSLRIDDIVDYKTEYSQAIEKAKITGDSISGLCPFHDDKNASFSADLKTGKFNCFACGASGNFTTFYSRLHNLETKEAYKQILERYGVQSEPKPKESKEAKPYTLGEYAFNKRLPEEWLKQKCGLTEAKEKDGTGYIRIPYYNERQDEQLFRKRYASTHVPRFKWKYGSAGKILMYGEWRLPAIRKSKYCVLVEGESDTQSLWFMGISAMGVPGASMFKPEWAEKLTDLKLYLHIEPDRGGQTFLQQMTSKLKQASFKGEVFTWSCSQFGCKDPSELYIQYGKDEANAKIHQTLREAKEVDIYRADVVIPETIKGEPISLRQPEKFEFSDNGIFMIDEKTQMPILVCKTPILITKRLESTNTCNEKIEIAFKRDNKWYHAIYPRSVVFQAKNIVQLADLGCTITSENAKWTVKYLQALEAENMDVLQKEKTTAVFGWQSDGTFMPGTSDLTLDIEPSLQSWADAYQQKGSFDEWKNLLKKHRERDRFRFITSAAFAAPLLKIIKQRIFIVYNWGGSKGGKTAALKAALSAWGDPDRLMINFNATQVALERMAGFYCDLPLGIDERQLAGGNNQNNLEKIVYMLSSGTGRARGSKSGGLQTMQQWRTVAMMTGEEPITGDNTMTGVSTRVLELYGPPFDDEKSASDMHRRTGEHCGWAGPRFIQELSKHKDDKIIGLYEEMYAAVDAAYNGRNNSHVTSIATVATADALLDSWIFENSATVLQSSKDRAKAMAVQVALEQMTSEVTDVNENAKNFVVDWILSNKNQFNNSHSGPTLGFTDEYDDCVWIFSSALNKALTDAGYSTRKTLRYFADEGLITTSKDESTGKVRFSTLRRVDKRLTRMIEFNLQKAIGESDNEIDDDDIELIDGPFGEGSL